MKEKSLQDKAISIKGKDYVLVSDRVLYFNENYLNGHIVTKRLEDTQNRVSFIATIIPDTNKPERFFTGHSQAVWGDGLVNKTSAMENAETSAVGRALAFMGIGVIDSIASADEINKSETNDTNIKHTTDKPIIASATKPASTRQINMIKQLIIEKGVDNVNTDNLSSYEASKTISDLLAKPQVINNNNETESEEMLYPSDKCHFNY